MKRPTLPNRLLPEELLALAVSEVESVKSRLPLHLAKVAEEVAVVMQDHPGAEVHPEFAGEVLLGYYVGHPLAFDAGLSEAPAPPHIYLYLENLYAHAFQRPRLFRREVRHTYLHELGHHLGLDEADLEIRGIG